jgi:ubiquinone/menaquinone biosynthesis C-methylase UbiE
MFRPRPAGLFALGLFFVASAMAHDLVTEADQVAQLMNLQPGMKLADVGAGDGEFGEELARRVGKLGHVYLTEVDDGELKKLRKRLKKSELANMSLVEGEADDTQLPDACCDAILLRYVFHHMSHPSEMRSSLRRALRPGGLIVVIEKDESGHGIPADDLADDMRSAGFEVVSRHPGWGGHGDDYGLVFRIAESTASSSPRIDAIPRLDERRP